MMKNKIDYDFPVNHILHAVQTALPKIKTIGNLNEFAGTLKNEIKFVDNDGGLTQVAEISPNGQVTLSIAYCQFLLLLCHIGLIIHDSIAVESKIEQMTDDERDEYIKELSIDSPLTRFLNDIPSYDSAIKYCAHLMDVAKPLLSTTHLTQDEVNAIAGIDYHSTLATKANSLCVYGIVFILLHEASHAVLGQNLCAKGIIEEEVQADHNAFWSMYSDLDGNEKNTALMGCICSLASLLFLNPTLTQDGVHPREDKRLFTFYDILKDEKPSYTEMLVILLASWAVAFQIDDFPQLSGSYEETLSRQREYLEKYENLSENESVTYDKVHEWS